MGPEMMLLSTVLTAGSAAVGAVGSYAAANAQADAAEQKAKIEAEWADRRAKEERGAAQRNAGEELRRARLAQSKLTAMAGGSGSGVDDPTIMDLWGDIEKEGRYNAATVTAGGEQKASGIQYQSALNSWAADSNARIMRSGATSSLIGGLLGAAGTGMQGYGRMSQRYSSPGSGGYGTGYGKYY